VDASIAELRRLREVAGEPKLKIIASALNMEHSKQITAAYRERGLQADYIHSREDSQSNKQVLDKLERHELDVIVQVRMLGEGFDHPYLPVAAVFSIFASLSPFVQFVGRIMRIMRVMRVIETNAPGDPVNAGSVVFHAGANTVKAWEDFKEFAEADQEWFRLLTEQVPVDGQARVVVDPTEDMERERDAAALIHITAPGQVNLEELSLLSDDHLKGMQRCRACNAAAISDARETAQLSLAERPLNYRPIAHEDTGKSPTTIPANRPRGYRQIAHEDTGRSPTCP
jgi:superfamily II DNA/RNA helicase